MISSLVPALISAFKARRELVLENVALRQQLAVLRRSVKRPRLSKGCLRCLLLVMCTYPFAKKALTLHLARGEGHERYFGCNLMQRKVLASSHQHLMTEAPADWAVFSL